MEGLLVGGGVLAGLGLNKFLGKPMGKVREKVSGLKKSSSKKSFDETKNTRDNNPNTQEHKTQDQHFKQHKNSSNSDTNIVQSNPEKSKTKIRITI